MAKQKKQVKNPTQAPAKKTPAKAPKVDKKEAKVPAAPAAPKEPVKAWPFPTAQSMHVTIGTEVVAKETQEFLGHVRVMRHDPDLCVHQVLVGENWHNWDTVMPHSGDHGPNFKWDLVPRYELGAELEIKGTGERCAVFSVDRSRPVHLEPWYSVVMENGENPRMVTHTQVVFHAIPEAAWRRKFGDVPFFAAFDFEGRSFLKVGNSTAIDCEVKISHGRPSEVSVIAAVYGNDMSSDRKIRFRKNELVRILGR